MKALVVCDRDEDLASLTAVITAGGWKCHGISRSSLALELLANHSFDLVLSEVVLSDLDGFALCEAIRRHPDLSSVAVVLYDTVLLAASEGGRAGAAGADDWMVKPCEAAELLRRLVDAVTRRRAVCEPGHRSLAPMAEKFQESSTTLGLFDVSLVQAMKKECQDLREELNRRREQQEALREVSQQLENTVFERTQEIAAFRRDFETLTYSISHDLKAPVRHIAGFVDLLQEHEAFASDSDAQALVQRIRKSALRLDQMIQSMLQISRISRSPLSLQTVSLQGLVEDLRTALLDDPFAHRVEWRVHPLPDVIADPKLLRLAVQHLMENAVKFSRGSKPPRIEIGVATGDREWRFWIRDNGAGFGPFNAHRLFSPFGKLHSEQEFEGAGMGLATVKCVVELHGGRVAAESPSEGGALFSFTLPMAVVSARKTLSAVPRIGVLTEDSEQGLT